VNGRVEGFGYGILWAGDACAGEDAPVKPSTGETWQISGHEQAGAEPANKFAGWKGTKSAVAD
jgi:hypothetical protein